MTWALSLLLLNGIPNLREYPTTISELASALGGEEKKMMWYAVRELNRITKHNTKQLQKTAKDSVEYLELRMEWSLLNELVAPECLNKIQQSEVISQCANILRQLKYKPALQEIQKAYVPSCPGSPFVLPHLLWLLLLVWPRRDEVSLPAIFRGQVPLTVMLSA